MSIVLYSKSSNERDRRFSLHTLMLEEDGVVFFRKVPDTPAAAQHVQNIALCEQRLREFYDPGQIQINQCRVVADGVELEYLDGTTLEEEIDRAYAEKGVAAAEDLIRLFFERTQPEQKLQSFRTTEAFEEIFGPHPECSGLPAMKVADVDMIFSNVICNTAGWHLIDFEWTFFFPIPAEFTRYRAIHYFLETSSRRGWLKEGGWERWNIDASRLPLWEEMERKFQEYILGDHTPLQELYVQMSPGGLDIRALDDLERRLRKDAIRIYWSQDGNLSEEQTLLFPLTEGWNRIHTRLPKGTTKLRLDPGERGAICSLRRWQIDGKKVDIVAHNGVQIADQVWVFPQEDPQWTVESGRRPMAELDVEIKIQQMDTDLLEAYLPEAGRGRRKRHFF